MTRVPVGKRHMAVTRESTDDYVCVCRFRVLAGEVNSSALQQEACAERHVSRSGLENQVRAG